MYSNSHEVVIVGGGISGLYCAWRLAELGRRVLLLEASLDRWGGRIETEEMDGFVAEYGPMRFEPTLQPRFAALCNELDIELIDFSGPEAEEVDAPSYDLPPEENGLDSLQLLRRGIMLLMAREPDDQAWIDGLGEDDYRRIRRFAQFRGKPLWEMGFWNALSSEGILSHLALTKLRDTGTFYHMIPENLNAAEWIIWWLRALKTVGQRLATIGGGSAKLTESLLSRLRKHPNVTLAGGHTLCAFRPLSFGDDRLELDVETRGSRFTVQADRLVLALPRLPLLGLHRSLPKPVASHLDSVNGFPMLKVFFVTDSPWWDYDQRPQQYACCLPTREIHYFRRPEAADMDGHGMVLLYMDRPATEFWKHYLARPDHHDRAEIDDNPDIVDAFALFVARDIKRLTESGKASLRLTARSREIFHERSVSEVRALIRKSIVTYGIRDWARAPYGAANHGWQPGVRSWKVMEMFRGFDFGSGARNIHIVGEAYSDYQGFIEGALNSAELALEIVRLEPDVASKTATIDSDAGGTV
ncbi:FAD-dependent oxidoreductase (plasmid) [Paraburkholderia sp. PREW-6R]|uniref:flavin monoamine oxidase family protein n=1 Tax=Paraburkholderia sp. PREW-6R TaxID=3141544 RepID=UPI0031F586EA